jgi:hypothetical protein
MLRSCCNREGDVLLGRAMTLRLPTQTIDSPDPGGIDDRVGTLPATRVLWAGRR